MMKQKIIHWVNAPTSLVLLIVLSITAINVTVHAGGSNCPYCDSKKSSAPPSWAQGCNSNCTKNEYPYCVGSGANRECLDNGGPTWGTCCGHRFRTYDCQMGNAC